MSSHTIPLGLDGVVLVDRAGERSTIAVAEALRIRAAATGELGWLFRGFDDEALYFELARLEPGPEPGRHPLGSCIVEAAYRVDREDDAERALGVVETIRAYTVGVRGVRSGMTEEEVADLLGPSLETRELGPVGSFDLVFEDLTVRFLEHRVAHVDAGQR